MKEYQGMCCDSNGCHLPEDNSKHYFTRRIKKAYNSFIKYLIKEDKKTENKDKRNITRKKNN
ncbi:MAG: hypothetical protein ACLR8X_14680 [Gallintestinimicrobium sp.]